ncbi:MAG: hypothetical protein K2Y39_06280 [Candidatus Obscuribacterales bacterium]|nr:hypothetical protein [Candidatus Obscuribacterales bacterium]
MNEIDIINLKELMGGPDGWGHEHGREVFNKLLEAVESHPGSLVFHISLKGVERTDASFPRESVVELAKRYRGFKGFCLIDVNDPDLLDNFDAAGLKREQPLIVWKGERWHLIGQQPTKGNADMLAYALSVPSCTAVAASGALKLQLTNASTKLKQLFNQGFLLRKEEVAPSGGVEFVYYRIK